MPVKKKTPGRKTVAPRPLLQMVMAAIGVIVTAAAVVIVVWEAMQPQDPPALSARIVEIQSTAAGYVATVQVANAGLSTAAGVDVEGVLGDQTATATLDYVPGKGHAKAYLRFDADPRGAAVSVKGWSAP